MEALVKESLLNAQQAASSLVGNTGLHTTVARAAQALSHALQAGGRVYACGNGGSMCDAMHFAEELSGRYRKDRDPLAAAAISDVGHMTCVSNDYGYDHVFSRWVQAHGRPGDVLVGISTSGTSRSILNAARSARERGMVVIAMHGRHGCELSVLADHDICTPAGRYADRVQECHIKIVHILIELVERQLFPSNYQN